MPFVRTRLSVMMFIQFFIWGAWYTTPYLWLGKIGFVSSDIGWMYSVGPIAGMISPFFLGMIADRFFATQRILGVMHLIGAGFMFYAATLMQQDYPSPATVNLVFFGHMLCFFPTLALVNTLALHNMDNPEKQFPLIRVFGTLGWIAAGLSISFFKWDAALQMFYVAAGAGVLMGLYSFTLPNTPPPSKGQAFSVREVLGLDALVLLKKPAYLIFMLCSFLICIPLSFYYILTQRFVMQSGFEKVAGTMSLGQMAEVVFMVAMPWFFARLGVKWMLFVGMLAWVVRYGLFAGASSDAIGSMIVGGILLHGICYDFFFVTGQIYTDQVAPKKIRGQAQGMLVLFTLGMGMFIGAQLCGFVEGMYTSDEAKAFSAEAVQLGAHFDTLRSSLVGMDADAAKPVKAEMAVLLDKIGGLQGKVWGMRPHWQTIWMVPAIGSAAVLLLFMLLFRDPGKTATEDQEAGAAAQPSADDRETNADAPATDDGAGGPEKGEAGDPGA